uniref:Uncharacterized protein n=1 Tax=Aegilops tauschii subsp. strangulata TaxID=200361 RepID=A0A453RR29_AEGTS
MMGSYACAALLACFSYPQQGQPFHCTIRKQKGRYSNKIRKDLQWICSGTRAQGIYKLRALRRETLFWINLLYRSSTPLSRSSILHSNARNCSSSHRTLLFCNVLETRDHLGISICFNKMQDVDSRSEMVISLASAISITTLESFLSEVVFLLIFLNCFCAFLARRMYALTWQVVSSPLLRTNKSSWTVIFSSIKVSCMALQRSSTTRDRPSSASTATLCRVLQRLTWLLGAHIISSMQLYMSASFLKPSQVVSMVAKGEEMVALRLWSCCSTWGLLERGLEGALPDLRW